MRTSFRKCLYAAGEQSEETQNQKSKGRGQTSEERTSCPRVGSLMFWRETGNLKEGQPEALAGKDVRAPFELGKQPLWRFVQVLCFLLGTARVCAQAPGNTPAPAAV